MQNNKTKNEIEFDSGFSVKSIVIQTNPSVKVTTRFMKSKMLMFAKTSTVSFVYDMIGIVCFPKDNAKVQATYKHRKMLLYQKLAYKDGTSLFFVFICNLNCQLIEKDSRNVIF